MANDLRIELIAESEKELLCNFMQMYMHDLSEFTGEVPDEYGRFDIGNYFDAYWMEEERHPFKIIQRGGPAGFALVRQLEDGVYSIAEFFILRSHRKTGLGRKAATMLFDYFVGTWHIAQDKSNVPAQKFWRSVINEYTGGELSEHWSDSQPRGPKQTFESRSLS